MRVGLKTRFFTVFAGFAGTLIATAGFIGSHLIGRAVHREAQTALQLDLAAAQHAVHGLAEEWSLLIGVLGGGRRVARALARPDSPDAVAALDAVRREAGFDIFLITDGAGRVILRASPPHQTGDVLHDRLARDALAGKVVSGLLELRAERLAREGDELADRLRGSGIRDVSGVELALFVAAPARASGGEIVGAVLAGVVLRRNNEVLSRMRSALGDPAGDHPERLPIVSIKAGGETLLTTGAESQRTPLPPLGDGTDTTGRPSGSRPAAPAGGPPACTYVAAAPLLEGDPSTTAILEVCIPERRFAALRRSLTAVYGGLGLIAVAAASAVAWLMAGHLTGPLKRLEHAAGQVSGGDLAVSLATPRVRDEVSELADAFNRMAAALRDHEDRLAVARRELETANARLSDLNHGYLSMLGFVAHELKNVLGTVSWSAQALDDGLLGELPATPANLVHSIRTCIDAAVAMSRNYLDLARIEDGQLRITPRPCDLERDIVAPVVEELRGEAQRKAMALTFGTHGELGVAADPEMLQVVIRNLLGNAIHYGRRGGQIRVECSRDEGAVTCGVWNEGEGLTAEQAACAFERFRRFGQRTADAPRGSGLGLFVSREIARSHGGDITVESVPGEWIRFTVRLPEGNAPVDSPTSA